METNAENVSSDIFHEGEEDQGFMKLKPALMLMSKYIIASYKADADVDSAEDELVEKAVQGIAKITDLVWGLISERGVSLPGIGDEDTWLVTISPFDFIAYMLKHSKDSDFNTGKVLIEYLLRTAIPPLNKLPPKEDSKNFALYVGGKNPASFIYIGSYEKESDIYKDAHKLPSWAPTVLLLEKNVSIDGKTNTLFKKDTELPFYMPYFIPVSELKSRFGR